MPRVKRGNKRRERRKKILSLAKGYFLTKGKLYRSAQESIMRAGNFAYTGRKLKKRDFRRLWIIRINAATRALDMSYSQFIAGLNRAGVTLDRKSLAEIAARDPKAFGALVESARKASEGDDKGGGKAGSKTGARAPRADAERVAQPGPAA